MALHTQTAVLQKTMRCAVLTREDRHSARLGGFAGRSCYGPQGCAGVVILCCLCAVCCLISQLRRLLYFSPFLLLVDVAQQLTACA